MCKAYWCDLYFTDPARLEDEAVLQVRRPFHPRLDDGRQCGGCTRSFHFFDLYQHASFVEKFRIYYQQEKRENPLALVGADVAKWIKAVDCESTMRGFNSRPSPITLFPMWEKFYHGEPSIHLFSSSKRRPNPSVISMLCMAVLQGSQFFFLS
jgi:hypothetical protein